MSWIQAINNYGVVNAGAFNIVSGLGGAASVVGFFTTLNFQKDTERTLAEIKAQLTTIERNTETIIQQNREILGRINELPTRHEVRLMLREEVAQGLIDQAYSNLRAAENDALEFWDSGSANWVSFRNSLQYLFDHDNRVSTTAEMLGHCSFAVQVSRGLAVPFVRKVVTSRKNRLRVLREILKEKTRDMLLHLRHDLLDDREYVTSHSLTDASTDLAIVYTMQSDKRIAVPGHCLVPHHSGSWCAEPGEPRYVIDSAYKRARDSHRREIEKHLEMTSRMNEDYGEIAHLVEVVEALLDILDSHD